MVCKSTMGSTSIRLHYLHCLHSLCAATTYGVKVVTQPTLNLHPLSPRGTTKMQDVQVVQVCPSLRFQITRLVQIFFPRGGQA